jgi:hypothetical protein
MNKITKYNYEAKYLDYLEDNLSEEERKAFELFMLQNPELFNDDFMDGDLPVIDQDFATQSYPDKEKIKLPEYAEELLFKKLEGELNDIEQKETDKLLQNNPALKKDWTYLKHTKLNPDLTVVFPDKQKLKKKTVVIPLWYKISMAASVALLIAFYLLIKNEPKQQYEPTPYSYSFNNIDEETVYFNISQTLNNLTNKNTKKQQVKSAGIKKQNIKLKKNKSDVFIPKIEKLSVQTAQLKTDVKPVQPEKRIIKTNIPATRKFEKSFTLNEYITYVFHKKVLQQEKSKFDNKTLIAVTEKLTAQKLEIEKQQNQQVVSIKWGDFSVTRKKSLN